LRIICPFRFTNPPGHHIDTTKTETLHSIVLSKQPAQRTKRILKAVREKKQITYNVNLPK
jgi:hypothetical protein